MKNITKMRRNNKKEAKNKISRTAKNKISNEK